MGQSWLVPIVAVLLGGGGIGTILGLIVQHQANKATTTAAAVAAAIDGLTKLSQEQRAEIADNRTEIADLKAQLKARKT